MGVKLSVPNDCSQDPVDMSNENKTKVKVELILSLRAAFCHFKSFLILTFSSSSSSSVMFDVIL